MSNGLELEIHANALIVRVQSIEIDHKTKPLTTPESIGPSHQEESAALERLAHRALELIGIANYGERNRRINEYKTSSNSEFSLYGVLIKPSPIKGLPSGSTGDLPFYLSSDHSDRFAVPELISLPIGRYPKQAVALEGIEHFECLFAYARYFATHTTSAACRFIHGGLCDLTKKTVILTGSYHIIKRPDLGRWPFSFFASPPRSFAGIYIQLNSTIDLTHFSSHGDESTYLNLFLGLVDMPGAKLEMCAIKIARHILWVIKASSRIKLNPWIEGAIGLAISQIFILYSGLTDPHGSVNKNLWHLYPKTSIQEILQNAYMADIPQYIAFVNHIGNNFAIPMFLSEIFRTIPVTPNQSEENILYISLYKRSRDLDVMTHRLSVRLMDKSFKLKPAFKIERAIHALLIVSVIDRYRFAAGNSLWAGMSKKDCEEYLDLAAICFGRHTRRIAGFAQPGSGRGKFELRGLQPSEMMNPPFKFNPRIHPLWANTGDLIEILNRLGKPCVSIPQGSNRREDHTIDTVSKLSIIKDDDPDRIWIPGLREEWWELRKKTPQIT